jgi:DNA primase
MRGHIPDETLHTIRERVSLVEVVSRYVSLKKAGRNHLGLCPFHSEKTPSFTVNEERGLFHCFGCGAGGTAFTFLMRMERLEFPEAVAQLAQRAGVELPPAEPSGAAAARERLYAITAHAARFFRDALHGPGGGEARRYLSGRGVSAATIERYGLGVAPGSGGALAAWLRQQRLAADEAVQLGLLGRRDDGGLYDRFRGRIMFPIRDRRERVIAFGGRTLGSDPPKYLNSPESPLFRKGEGLYGLGEARAAIRSAGRVVLVEGYLDALLLVQEGIPYTVAVLGTALTAAQLRLLRPFGGDDLEVYIFFDGDEAGQRAVERAFAVCADAEVWGKAVFLPSGFDPDSFVRQHGRAAVLDLLERAVPISEFYFGRLAAPGSTLPQRTSAARKAAEVIGGVRSEAHFQVLRRQAATYFGVGDELFVRARAAARPAPAAAGPAPAAPTWSRAEVGLLEAMAADPAVARWAAERGLLEHLTHPDLVGAGHQLARAALEGVSVSTVIESLPPSLSGRLSAVLLDWARFSEASPMRMAEDYAARLEEQAAGRRRRLVVAELRRAELSGDDAELRAKLASLQELHARRRHGGAR